MKKFLLFLLVIVLLIGAFVFYTLSNAGFFRTLENSSDYSIAHIYDVVGAEDFAISRVDSFLLISSDDRAARITGGERKGGIYFLDLKTDKTAPKLISAGFGKPFFPHGISLVRIDSAQYKLFVINHVEGKHSVEIFQLNGDQLTHEKTLRDELLVSPNDLVAIDAQRFYYTNDHLTDKGFRAFAAKFLGVKDSNVGYYDGQKFSIVAEGFRYSNGINFDKSKNKLYVASMLDFIVKVFDRNEDGSLTFVENVACNTGVDNIELDENGKLWIGCHPNLLAAGGYLKGEKPIAPTEVITIEYNKKGDYKVQSIYINDGKEMSASSVALPFDNKVFVGNVMDDHFMVIKAVGQ